MAALQQLESAKSAHWVSTTAGGIQRDAAPYETQRARPHQLGAL